MTPGLKPALALACALLAAAPAAGAASRPAAAHARPVAAAKAKATRSATAPAAEPGTRRLEDVHIEGELEVPRVTFITVRQPHRFTDYVRATSVRPARRMAADATLPAWIPAFTTAASDARKENRK